MPGHGPDGFRVTLAPCNPLVKATDVPARRAPAREADRVRRFDERPFEVAVDVRSDHRRARSGPDDAGPRRLEREGQARARLAAAICQLAHGLPRGARSRRDVTPGVTD